jgi:hypothetical protein
MKPATDEEIINMIADLQKDKLILQKRTSYLESVLSEILMLNALRKTLKIDQAIRAAVDITE